MGGGCGRRRCGGQGHSSPPPSQTWQTPCRARGLSKRSMVAGEGGGETGGGNKGRGGGGK